LNIFLIAEISIPTPPVYTHCTPLHNYVYTEFVK